MTGKPEVYVVILTAQPGTVPPAVRLRKALKLLLRVCGLRCTSVTTGGAAGHAVDAGNGSGGDPVGNARIASTTNVERTSFQL